jgi:DNA polymerase III delta prime subunit
MMRTRDRDLAERLGKLVDKDLLQSLTLLGLVEDDEEERQVLEQDLEACLLAKHLPALFSDDPIFSYPTPQSSAGAYLVGEISNQGGRYPFKLREEEAIRHLLLVGVSGAGKTNTVYLLIEQFFMKNKPFLAIDWKRSYRDLLTLPEAKGKEMLVFTVGRDICPFHFNALIPPAGTSPHVWLSKIIEIISHAYFLGEGVMYILTKTIDSVYKEFGVYQGSGMWPTFRNVLHYLENYESKGRETQWLASALRAVATLCFGEMDRILNAGHYPINELLERNVILEVDALTDSAKIFLTEALLLWIHHHRMAEGKREEWKHTIIIEEAHHILSRKLQIISGTETITEIICREIREFGESLIILDQDPSLLSVPALGNTYTTICFNLKAGSDINVMRSVLNLSFQDKDFLSRLELGQAVVKLQGRWPDPFLIQIPKVNIAKGRVTDEDLEVKMTRFYDELERNRAETSFAEESGLKTPAIKGEEKQRKTERRTETKTNEPKLLTELNGEERGLLVDIFENEISQVVERYARLGLNKYQGNKAQQALLERDLIKAVKLPSFEKRGYWGKTFELTEKGREAVAALGYPIPDTETLRRGGVQHRHIIRLIAGKLQQEGHQVAEEAPLGDGKTTDLLVDGKIAIEVDRSLDNTAANVKKNLAKGLSVIVVCSGETSKPHAEKLLKQAGLLDHVTVVDATELLRSPLRLPSGERR